ncbi:MAG: hypothetical protein V3T05_05765 [Myxococcota bacterium]
MPRPPEVQPDPGDRVVGTRQILKERGVTETFVSSDPQRYRKSGGKPAPEHNRP